MSPKENGGDADNIVPGLMAISVDEIDADERGRGLERAAEVGGGRRADRADLRARFPRPEEEDVVDRVSRFVDFAIVDDPVQGARDAMEADDRVTASPVHTLGFHWHASYSATTPKDVEDVAFPAVAPGDESQVIAVVDSGIVAPEALPDWMRLSIISDSDDVEELHDDEEVSHGTFVTSLLRQIAPTHSVSIAKTGGLEDVETQAAPDHPKPFPTTEMHIAGAIDRLVERHRGSNAVEALNLSIGGPTPEDLIMVTLQQAIGRWRDAFPRTPIFAAAGNTPDPEEIYPAAYRYVRGVAAANHEGNQIVWKNDSPTEPPRRSWVDDVAPGLDLIGLSGRGAEDAVKWSGSSFADRKSVV